MHDGRWKADSREIRTSCRFVARVRHHTDARSLRAIQQEQAIQPSRTGGVDVEREPFGPPYRKDCGVYWSASDDLGAAGRGAYVEFDLPDGVSVRELPEIWFAGGRSAVTILLPPEMVSLPIAALRPRFVKWWRWYHVF